MEKLAVVRKNSFGIGLCKEALLRLHGRWEKENGHGPQQQWI